MATRSRPTTSPTGTSRRALASTLLAAGLLLAPLSPGAARAQQSGVGPNLNTTQQQRELDEGIGPSTTGSVLDATNPIDLMNRIRRATALDNATPPRDAIDAALRDFEAGSQPAPGTTPGSSLMKAP